MTDGYVLRTEGVCPVCEQAATFAAKDPWLRDHYLCLNCNAQPRERALFRFLPAAQRLVRDTVYLGREATVLPFMKPGLLGKIPAQMAKDHLKRAVRDPELRAKLTPSYGVGCKRILLSNEWYPALQQPNVKVQPLVPNVQPIR